MQFKSEARVSEVKEKVADFVAPPKYHSVQLILSGRVLSDEETIGEAFLGWAGESEVEEKALVAVVSKSPAVVLQLLSEPFEGSDKLMEESAPVGTPGRQLKGVMVGHDLTELVEAAEVLLSMQGEVMEEDDFDELVELQESYGNALFPDSSAEAHSLRVLVGEAVGVYGAVEEQSRELMEQVVDGMVDEFCDDGMVFEADWQPVALASLADHGGPEAFAVSVRQSLVSCAISAFRQSTARSMSVRACGALRLLGVFARGQSAVQALLQFSYRLSCGWYDEITDPAVTKSLFQEARQSMHRILQR